MTRKLSRIRIVVLLGCVVVYSVTVLAVGAYRAREDQLSTSDFDDFWKTGRHFLQTGEVQTDYGVHNYLPFFVLSIAPFSALPIKVASIVFNAIALAGFALSVRLVDDWLPQDGGFLRLAAPIGMVLAYVTGCLVMGQMALYTLTMLVLSWRCVERRRETAAGFWLALAISTKVYPVVLILFYVLKRKWRLLGGAGASLAVMNVVLPCLAFGIADTWRLHREFLQRSARGQSGFRLAAVDSNKMSYTNQSSALVARRYTRPTASGVEARGGGPRFINLVAWDASPVGFGAVRLARVQWALLAFYGITVAGAAWICRHPARIISMPRMRHEYAAMILLALLLSPIVWSFYYCLCYPPLALLNARVFARCRGGPRLSGSTLTAVLWWLALPALASPFARMCGYHLLATCILFITMLAFAARFGCADINPNE